MRHSPKNPDFFGMVYILYLFTFFKIDDPKHPLSLINPCEMDSPKYPVILTFV